MYKIIWTNPKNDQIEIVDKTTSLKNAYYLRQEYNISFNGGVTIEKHGEIVE